MAASLSWCRVDPPTVKMTSIWVTVCQFVYDHCLRGWSFDLVNITIQQVAPWTVVIRIERYRRVFKNKNKPGNDATCRGSGAVLQTSCMMRMARYHCLQHSLVGTRTRFAWYNSMASTQIVLENKQSLCAADVRLSVWRTNRQCWCRTA